MFDYKQPHVFPSSQALAYQKTLFRHDLLLYLWEAGNYICYMIHVLLAVPSWKVNKNPTDDCKYLQQIISLILTETTLTSSV